MKFRLSNFHLLTQEVMKEVYIPVLKFAHKGNNGLGILIAGSRNMPGAALLSAKAALRSGLGKLIVHAPDSVLDKVAFYIPEAILDGDPNPDCFSSLPDVSENCKAIAVGPGLGRNPATVKGIFELLKTLSYPIIIDADALNILSENKLWLDLVPENSILTPHAGEFDRLTEKSDNHFERALKTQDFAQKHHIIVVLKGHYTTIALPDGNIFINTTGNQGMATAGSGDVLTGVILGLFTKGYTPENSAKLGVYLHGLAGNCALEKQSYESLIASDIIENLGKAFKILQSK
ncbi:MAG: NAD(P)H-hydrate dehydratase [Bacteroidetes bacterium]|nr:NAD(P)H-hydrate dehydratase [Bacteroidota bacterium]MCL2301707.1 NAD(P)H-hydrate dehydratase [Lentimicrobiaceae bacterium]